MEKGGHHFERSLAGDGVSPVRTSKTSWCNVPFCEADPTIRSLKNRVANVTGVPLANSEHVQVLQYDPGDFYRQHHDQNAHPLSPWGPRLYTFFLYLSNVAEGVGSSTDQPLPCPRSLNMACVASTLPPLRLEPDLISSSSDLIRSTQPATVPTSPPVYAPPVWQGGTRFTHLNITVEAKRGRALFWPSVLNSDPSAVRISSDHRTTHEALTVTKGQKFAANMWLHQFDFQVCASLHISPDLPTFLSLLSHGGFMTRRTHLRPAAGMRTKPRGAPPPSRRRMRGMRRRPKARMLRRLKASRNHCSRRESEACDDRVRTRSVGSSVVW